MCVKLLWSGPMLSQPPQASLPAAILTHLSKGPAEPTPRKTMSATQLMEYRNNRWPI